MAENPSGSITERLASVQERMAGAARRSGRADTEITLVAVTKRQPKTVITTAVEAGILNIGENYVQEALDKRNFGQSLPCRWHLLGHLQSNKARASVEMFDLIQSVDSARLARVIGKYAEDNGKVQPILLQVHLGDEESKFGLPAAEVPHAYAEIAEISGIKVQGLMGIAPQNEDARPHFRLMRRLFDALPEIAQSVLSMGMTGDFETGIEEGATMVRIGTALFGPRLN